MRKFLIITILSLFNFQLFAQETAETIEPVQESEVKSSVKRIDNQHNYFSIKLLTLSGTQLSYARRLGGRFLLGASIFAASYQQGDRKHGSGDLDAGQYFAQEGQVDMNGQEMNMTFFFREDGYKKWGPSFRAAFGRAEGKIQGSYYRYDRDPGFFNFDDDKRLRETGPTVKDHFVTPYARLGAYYQFVWTPKASIGGHILELGASAAFLRDRPSITITRSNGTTAKIQIDKPVPIAEVAYAFTF